MFGRLASGRTLAVVAMAIVATACSSGPPPVTVPASFDVSSFNDYGVERTRGIIEEGRALVAQITPPPSNEFIADLAGINGAWYSAARFAAPPELEDLYRHQASNYEAILAYARGLQDGGYTRSVFRDYERAREDAQRIEDLLLALFDEYESR